MNCQNIFYLNDILDMSRIEAGKVELEEKTFSLRQLIINFISNAVKFTSEGEVTVTFRQMMVEDGTLDLMICVHDTGSGMSSEFINHIFRPL